jgi:hydrogenase-4 component B
MSSAKRRAAKHAAVGVAISSGIIALGVAAIFGRAPSLALGWSFPFLGTPQFAMTHFGGLFAVIAGAVALPVSLASASYLAREPIHRNVLAFSICYCAMLLAIAAVLSAADVIAFAVSWEIMSLAACGSLAFDPRRTSNGRAATVMLVASELGTLAAVLAFLIASGAASSLEFGTIARSSGALSTTQCALVAIFSFFGFGVKAGILPFNAWLPKAYDAAPSHVAAIFSGALANLGLYGMVLLNVVLVPQNAMLFGLLALTFGALSAITGILYATIENRLKSVLAFSSIENLGIAVAALGAGSVFAALGRSDLAALGIGAGLWHAGNHSLYKSLLFLGTESVDDATGTDNINVLGGVARAMPVTSACFLIGALAISSIPPLNGFASEWLVLQTLLRSAEITLVPIKVGFVLAGALLALTAALAATCFVKAFGMTFLGLPRSDSSERARGETGAAARIAMVLLATACLATGVFPSYVVQLVDAGLPIALRGRLADALLPPFLSPLGGGLPQSFLSTFQSLGATIGAGTLPGRGFILLHRSGASSPIFAMSATYIAFFIVVFLALIYVFVRVVSRSKARNARVWAGGLRPFLPEMTYTATGFSNPVRVIFDAIFNPATVENTRSSIHEHFRVAIKRRREDEFFADRWIVRPISSRIRAAADLVARMHHGRLGGYVAYTLAVLLIVLFVALL